MSPRAKKAALEPVRPMPVVDTSDCLFDPEKHLYSINGIVVPSVTQVLEEERFVDFSGIPSDTLEQAKARGTYVHQVLHAYLEEDFDVADTDPRFRGYVDSAIAFLESADMKPLRSDAGTPLAVEYRFYDRIRGFAGTIDYVAWDPDGVLSLNDWKTGEPTDVAAALQTAAYEYGLRITLFPDHKFPIRRRAIKLYRDGSPGRVEPYDDVRDLGMFFTALSCVHFRRNRMRYSR